MRTRSLITGLALLLTGTAIGVTTQQLASADVSSGDRPVLRSVTPCRLADTRAGTNTVGPRSTPLGPADTITVEAQEPDTPCTGVIPSDALAVSLNITALNATSQSFLTIWSDGDRPLAASLNPAPGQPPVPNAVTTELSSAQAFQIYNDAGTVDVVIDVNGYYVNHDHDDRYSTEPVGTTLTRTVMVPGDGTDLENGAAFDDAVEFVTAQNPTDDDRWLIKLEPGVFAISGGTMPANARIEGSGRDATQVICRVAGCTLFVTSGELAIADLAASSHTLDTVRVLHSALFESVSIESSSGSNDAVSVEPGAVAVFDNASIVKANDTSAVGSGVSVDDAIVLFRHSVMFVSDPSIDGFVVIDGRLEIEHSTITTDGYTVFSCCQAGDSSTIIARHSTLTSRGDTAIHTNSSDVDITIEHSTIEQGSSFGTAVSLGAADGTQTLTVAQSSIHGNVAQSFGDPSTVIMRSSFVDGTVAATAKQCRGITTATGFFASTCP